MGLESLFKWLVDGMDVVYNLLNVPISGVFAFDELELSYSLVGRVSDEFTVGPKCVTNHHDKVRFVVCLSIVCQTYVFRYGVFRFRCVRFVVL